MAAPSNYTQGYSQATLVSHTSRTVETDAAFLLPLIKPDHKILDVGCGPGTITLGFSEYVPVGMVTGIDISSDVLESARARAQEMKTSGKLKGDVIFLQNDLLQGLSFPDNSFDVVYASQLFSHMPSDEVAARALTEMRRVLRPGGVMATRDVATLNWFPDRLDMHNLFTKSMLKGLGIPRWPGQTMPAIYRHVGFDVDGGNLKVGCGTTCHADEVSRAMWASTMAGRLGEGDEYRASWVRAGIPEWMIDMCRARVMQWASTNDAWYVALQAEIVARK